MPNGRSRRHRDSLLAPIALQPRDLAVVRDLFYLRWASTSALFLTAYWAHDGTGMSYFPKRLTHAWRAGVVERFEASFSRYLAGSREFLYVLGDGKASAAARTHCHPRTLSGERWRDVLAEAAPARDRTREALLAAGIDHAEIDRVLHNNSELAMKHYAGESSGVRHHVLTSELVSLLWFSARMQGWPVEDIQPDGVADLSFRDPEPHRHRELVTADGLVPIKPDCMFTIAGHRFAIEAETGSASAAKLRRKLRRYARLFDVTEKLPRVIVHCATDAHARLSLATITDLVPAPHHARFLVSQAALVAPARLRTEESSRFLTTPHFRYQTPAGERDVALFATL